MGDALEIIAHSAAFWGLIGVLIYAAPRFLVCLRENSMIGNHCSDCMVEGGVAIIVGVAAATAFAPWISSYLHATKDHDMRAVASLVGVLANPLSPQLVKVFDDGVVGFIKRWFREK